MIDTRLRELIAIVNDWNPTLAKLLNEEVEKMGNAIYYTRRDNERLTKLLEKEKA